MSRAAQGSFSSVGHTLKTALGGSNLLPQSDSEDSKNLDEKLAYIPTERIASDIDSILAGNKQEREHEIDSMLDELLNENINNASIDVETMRYINEKLFCNVHEETIENLIDITIQELFTKYKNIEKLKQQNINSFIGDFLSNHNNISDCFHDCCQLAIKEGKHARHKNKQESIEENLYPTYEKAGFALLKEIVTQLAEMKSICDNYSMIHIPISFAAYMPTDFNVSYISSSHKNSFNNNNNNNGNNINDNNTNNINNNRRSSAASSVPSKLVDDENLLYQWLNGFILKETLKMYTGNDLQEAIIGNDKSSTQQGIKCGGCQNIIDFVKDNHYPIYYAPSVKMITFIFHDSVCVKLRKYKEAIRRYVFESEAKKHEEKMQQHQSQMQSILNIHHQTSSQLPLCTLPDNDVLKVKEYIKHRDWVISLDNGVISRPKLPKISSNIYFKNAFVHVSSNTNIDNLVQEHEFRRERKVAAMLLQRSSFFDVYENTLKKQSSASELANSDNNNNNNNNVSNSNINNNNSTPSGRKLSAFSSNKPNPLTKIITRKDLFLPLVTSTLRKSSTARSHARKNTSEIKRDKKTRQHKNNLNKANISGFNMNNNNNIENNDFDNDNINDASSESSEDSNLSEIALQASIYAENIEGFDEKGETDIPTILQYMDVHLYGRSLWQFCVIQLQTKDRPSLWQILQYLASKLPTPIVITLLEKHRDTLSKFDMLSLDELCLKIIETSAYNIATSLYLSSFMRERADNDLSREDKFDELSEKYIKIAQDLIRQIESDHLLAILLEIPTDINELTIFDIALRYKMDNFLDFHRLQPIIMTLWNEFEYLDPQKSFYNTQSNYYDIFRKLLYTPACFYYSPIGLYITSSVLYCTYVVIVTNVIANLIYPYDEYTGLEYIMWFSNFGYVLYEIMEMIFKKSRYFVELLNWFDIVICINWIILAIIRLVIVNGIARESLWKNTDQYGNIDQAKSRNTILCQIYIGVFCVQVILLWMRVGGLLQRTRTMGPLIRMVYNMTRDILNFLILLFLFTFGFIFALFYIIGGDLSPASFFGLKDNSRRLLIDDNNNNNFFNANNTYDVLISSSSSSGNFSSNVTCSSEGNLGSFQSIALYIFQAILGQHDWDAIKSACDFGSGRSRLAQFFLITFSVLGAILLLNLLIALMASTFDSVRERAKKQVNFAIFQNTIELANKSALMPPPLNMIVFSFTIIWIILSVLVKIFTCGRYHLNGEFIYPVHYSLHDRLLALDLQINKANQYIEAQQKIKKSNSKLFEQQQKNQKKQQQQLSIIPLKQSSDKKENIQNAEDEQKLISAIEDDNNNNNNNNNELKSLNIDTVNVAWTRRRTNVSFKSMGVAICKRFKTMFAVSKNQKSLSPWNDLRLKNFCRHCRHEMIDDETSDKSEIESYFRLFKYYQLLDDEDKRLMKRLLKNKFICDACYRPYTRYLNGDTERLYRWQVMLEILSYYVFILCMYIPLIILLFLPAMIYKLVIKFKRLAISKANVNKISANMTTNLPPYESIKKVREVIDNNDPNSQQQNEKLKEKLEKLEMLLKEHAERKYRKQYEKKFEHLENMINTLTAKQDQLLALHKKTTKKLNKITKNPQSNANPMDDDSSNEEPSNSKNKNTK